MDIILALYQDKRTVFKFNEIALLTGETNFSSINQKLNYYVRTKKLQNPRRGIYTKPEYNQEEMACKIFVPAYISLEYVLQRAGIIFQYDSSITSVSYLSRRIEVDEQPYQFRRIKEGILINTRGINQQTNGVNIAIPERAFLDILYLNFEYYFDNLNPLDKAMVYKLLPFFQSKALAERVKNLLQND